MYVCICTYICIHMYIYIHTYVYTKKIIKIKKHKLKTIKYPVSDMQLILIFSGFLLALTYRNNLVNERRIMVQLL